MCLEPCQLADVFLFLFDEKKLTPITIKGYRSVITRVYRLSGQSDPRAVRDLSLLLDNFNLDRQRVQCLFPSGRWYCAAVSEDRHFRASGRGALTAPDPQTVFLITLASAARVNGKDALSTAPDYLRVNDNGAVSRLTAPGFMANNRLPEEGSQCYTWSPLEEDVVPVRFELCGFMCNVRKRLDDRLIRCSCQ